MNADLAAVSEAPRLPPFFRSRAPLIAVGLATAAVFAVGFLPLFNTPGYEIALAAGLIVPPLSAIATALELSSAIRHKPSPRKEEGAPPVDFNAGLAPVEMLLRGIANGAAFATAAYVTTVFHGLRTGFCDALSGSWMFALGPFFGAILAGAWGALSAEIAGHRTTARRRRAAAIALALAGPLAGVLVSLWRFFSSPMVFAYDPFAGYFSGTLYDTVIDASGLFTYRVGSAATLVAALVLAFHLRRNERGTIALAWRHRPGIALFGGLAVLASVLHIAFGSELGHHQSAESIAKKLGGKTEGERCVVLHPRGMRADEVGRFVRDCDAHVRKLERWFEAEGPKRITAYLFADVRQKAALMGAAETQIAKPWRKEVYVQASAYPHPAIGHELAHVIAGTFASGPLRTAGDLGGLVPNPGLVEGVAVAAAPREGDLSPMEWAKAMKGLGILPKLDSLFALGFLGANSGVAYTVSGAFVEYIKSSFGVAAVRDWYGGRSLPAITGATWPELEARFHAELDALPIADAALAQAKARFDRPGIFGRRCPHVVDACRRKAEALKDAGDEEGVLEQYAIIAALDPNDPMSRIQVARSKIRKGEVEIGIEALRAVAADESAPRHVRDRALEDLADLELGMRKKVAPAMDVYREIMTRIVDEDTLRTLEVKAYSVDRPMAREAIFYFLVGEPERGPDRVRAAELFGAWSRDAPDDGMPDYLMGRQLYASGLYAKAAVRLDTAQRKGLPLPRVEVETQRLRIITACALGDTETARKTYDAYGARPEVPRARREAMAALVERCSEASRAPAMP